MYTLTVKNGHGVIHYKTPLCGFVKVCDVFEIGTKNERILFVEETNGKPFVTNMLRMVVQLIDAHNNL